VRYCQLTVVGQRSKNVINFISGVSITMPNKALDEDISTTLNKYVRESFFHIYKKYYEPYKGVQWQSEGTKTRVYAEYPDAFKKHVLSHEKLDFLSEREKSHCAKCAANIICGQDLNPDEFKAFLENDTRVSNGVDKITFDIGKIIIDGGYKYRIPTITQKLYKINAETLDEKFTEYAKDISSAKDTEGIGKNSGACA
jgi:hypothetical protein